ncbi:ty3-gypsy retrotransposon protein [Cucumis melo var. makuwa]|uniref:Ty3-gypsy retrotransposon protein n=1 Tax=Cucumis melo var. makuwa TaxID=1194695 RepID=A0A5D3CB07_CUCMM|nr:ty3-gypsy retrotransposon protein [Cucumis melo var. makuwa]TYK07509.1 ty3-gypsy retrotransposon protein [Cucumis melo var. makuwa]
MGSPNQSFDRAQPTLSPSLFVSATSDASSLFIPCTRCSPKQLSRIELSRATVQAKSNSLFIEPPKPFSFHVVSWCWGGDVRVEEFYGKRSQSQLSSAWVDSFGRGLERDFSYIVGKGFLTTGPRIEAGNVVTRMGIIRNVTVSCSLCSIICNELFTDRHRCLDVPCIVVMLVGYVVNWNSMSMGYKVLMLGKLKSIVGTLVMELCRGRIKV